MLPVLNTYRQLIKKIVSELAIVIRKTYRKSFKEFTLKHPK